MQKNAYNLLTTDSNPVHQQNLEQVGRRIFKAARKYPMEVLEVLEACEKESTEETAILMRSN